MIDLVPEKDVLHAGLLMVARVLLPLAPSNLLYLLGSCGRARAIVVDVQTPWPSWSVE